MHEYIPVILLVASVFVGIWLNRRDATELKSDMNRQFDSVNKRIDTLEVTTSKRFDTLEAATNMRFDTLEAATSKRFDTLQSELNKRIETLQLETSKRMDRIVADLKEFYGQDKLLEGRVNELSARLK